MKWQQAKADARLITERVQRESGITLTPAAVQVELQRARPRPKDPRHVATLLVEMLTRPQPIKSHRHAIAWAVQQAQARELTPDEFLSRLGTHTPTTPDTPPVLTPAAPRFLQRLAATDGRP